MRKYFCFLIILLTGCLCGFKTGYSQSPERGTSVFSYSGYAPFADRPVDVHYHIPSTGGIQTMPIVFVMEGADRGYIYLLDAWKKEAEKRGFIVAVLHFDLQLYPLADYQETGVMTKDRTMVKEPSQQTSSLIDRIFLQLRRQTGTKAEKYYIYGHSAGGQFIQRFMLFFDSPYVKKAIIGSPGWYTFPDTTQWFPYGTKNIPYITQESVKRYLAKNIVLQLGMADTIRESFLRKTPEAEAQGRDRLERGRTFYNYLLKLAGENDWPCNWQKVEVPNVGHNSVEMGQKSLLVMFKDSTFVPQPQEVSERFYTDPVKTWNTPTLRKPKEEGLASLKEIMGFLEELTGKHPDKVHMASLGTTPGKQDIPVLYFGSGNNTNKVKVWIQAGLHGNEPAGPEAVCLLVDYLLNTKEGQKLLDQSEIAFVPVANPDGYALQTRQSGSNLDLNRDQSKLSDPVSVILKQAFSSWSPEVALDIHEFTPWRKDYDTYFKKKVAIFDDVLFLPTGHPNVSPLLREFSYNILQKRAEEALKENGFNPSFYFTPQWFDKKLYLQKGAKSPQSSSTSFALSNALSMFIEIRGLGLGRISFARRAESGFIVARNLLQTCYAYKKQIKTIVSGAITETKKGQCDINVTFRSKTIPYPVRFVDFQQNDTFSVVLPVLDGQYSESVLTRKRPAAYILSDTCRNAARILEILGVKVEKIVQPLFLKVEQYTITSYKKETTLWENIYPVEVKVTTQEVKKEFPPGSYIIRLKQKNANYAVTLLEPESENGFVSFNVINATVGQELPIYRSEDLIKLLPSYP